MDDVASGREPTRLIVSELHPASTAPGVAFNPQPNGQAALAVRCRNATTNTRIVFGGVGLPTVYAGSDLVTALVPSELYRCTGAVEVYLRDVHLGASNRLTFRVTDGTGRDHASRPGPAAGADREPTLLIFILHFGSWPEWLPLFLETCRANPTIDWLIVTDCPDAWLLPPNVRLRRESLADVTQRIEDALGYAVPIEFPYKLCDLRLAFPKIFDDLTIGYDFFGWGDLDVVYGDIRRVLDREAFENDVITFYEEHLSGHLTLVRNTAAIRELHRQVPGWEAQVRLRDYQHLDEPRPELPRQRFPVWAKQSYNTPLSPYAVWRDGTFNFPKEWYWQDGRLTNDIDGDVEFLYLHFMHWKGGPWARACGNAQWERLDRVVHFDPAMGRLGFRVNERGFFPLGER